MWQGSVVSIHIAPEAGAPLIVVPQVRAIAGQGLEGDRYATGRGYYSPKPSLGGREVTLIEMEAVEALAEGVLNAEGERGGIKLNAAQTRRNIATRGVPLNHLVNTAFRVGEVVLRGTRLCEPCKYLDSLTQPGVMALLVHRGGLRAQIVQGGIVRVGDTIKPEETP
ncbi:MAG TPA: MOSC domain-containing protein [Methylomirabilota bacterium]|nr:MOSC domain-containing protein [Methylomirabilota bacterium]